MKERPLQSDFRFRVMALEFRLRDLIRSPLKILQEAGIRDGMTVLDFGCGPGSFSPAAVRLVGSEGRVCALDIHPLAIRSLQRAAAKRDINNIQTMLAGSIAEIPRESIDVILLYDVLHDISDPTPVLAQMRRVLKPEGALSVSDHHLEDEALLAAVTAGRVFMLASRGRWTYRFERTKASEAAT